MQRKFNTAANLLAVSVILSFFTFSNAEINKETALIAVQDSLKLSTDIYLPEGDDPFTCVLIRTPYNKNGVKGDAKQMAENGFAVVAQDTRGKYQSDGTFYPFRHEREDGLATIQWIKSQSWSNGKIIGWGGSYVGYTQWAVADCLDVMVPVLTTANMYDALYPSGLFSLATAFNWGLAVDSKTSNEIPPEKYVTSYSILPLSVADDSTWAQNDFLDDWLSHQDMDDYWKVMNHRGRICPMISIAGWYDIFLEAQIDDFETLKTHSPSSRLIIGPYAHGEITIDTNFKDHLNPYSHLGAVSKFIQDTIMDSSMEETPDRYSLFILNQNTWYTCRTWPPINTLKTPYFLHPDGRLSIEPPKKEATFQYTYNPMDPYPSLGGTFLGFGVGPAFQNPNIERKDQVIFESAPLKEPLILLGPISSEIYAKTDAALTDFFVSLHHIRPDGKIINIQEGGAIFAGGNFDLPQKLAVSLWATGYQIPRDHRLRVVITSALFPRYNRNLNSTEKIFDAHTPRAAQQQIVVGPLYASKINLPVLHDNF